jgi:DNA-nicking Smr family endonuclease
MTRRNKSDLRFNAPFRDLDKRLSRRKTSDSEKEKPAPPPFESARSPESLSGPDDDATLFDRAMAGVAPVDRGPRRRPGPKPVGVEARRVGRDEDEEVHAILSGLVSGEVPFDITETGEYVEGFVQDFDRRALRRLRAGEISVQDEIDLHRMTRDEARAALDPFILGAAGRKVTCVRVVHGRGLHSKEEGPVLKAMVVRWLAGRRLGKVVLAFTSARPVDGGTGALYVLLRRRPRP